MQLDPEQHAWIKTILAQAGVKDPDAAAVLARNVCATMSDFATEREESGRDQSFRKTHDRLRKIWRLADETDPEIGVIRGQLRDLR